MLTQKWIDKVTASGDDVSVIGPPSPPPDTVVYTVNAPHFNAGFVVENGRVIQAAPILNYLKGWTVGRAMGYLLGKGWKITR